MNIEVVLKEIEAIICSLKLHKPKFTGQLKLEINFYEGEVQDIVKESERERIKIARKEFAGG